MSLELSRKALAVKPSSTLAISAKAKELKAKGIDVVGFGAGEPDFNTPENICEAACKAIESGYTKYTPASGAADLKEAVCRKLKEVNGIDYKPSQIVISNGAKHSLTNAFQAILNPGDEVIIPAPYWLSYPEIIKLCDGVPVFVRCEKEQSYKVRREDLEKVYTSKTKAVVINSPCNPTGMIYTKEELEDIAAFAVEKDIYVIADEIYEYLIYGGQEHVSIASLNDEIYARTITINGLSKSYAMTGWRMGYTGSPEDIAKVMGSVQSHETSNPSSITQAASVEALNGPQDTVAMMNEAFNERRKFIYKRAIEIPHLSAVEPLGAFYLFVDCSEMIGMKYKDQVITSAADIAKYLLEDYHVAIVPCADFGFDDHFRLAYAISMEQINKGMDRIEAFANDLTK